MAVYNILTAIWLDFNGLSLYKEGRKEGNVYCLSVFE
jgi:hypothetical protein